jgi:2-oxoglutarate ferredoxin oxidoreductase subunit beta
LVSPSDFKARMKIDWCPGCGNFGIINSVKKALVDLGYGPSDVVVVSGIGCSAKLPHFINLNGFHSLHGRALPVATGIKLASGDMPVIAVTGDGDGMGIGGTHFIHTARRNVNILHVLHNNAVYGLTTGQAAPTTKIGQKTKTTPRGSYEEPIQPVPMALAAGATFVARTYVGDFKHCVETYKAAIQHRGYALVDTLQPCVTFNKMYTYDYYNERVYKLPEDHDATDLGAALIKGHEWGDEIPLGIFYQVERPTLEDALPGLDKGTLSQRDISDVDITPLLKPLGLE